MIEKEAKRFWKAYIGEHYKGEPGFAPLYAMYSWIRETVSLGKTDPVSLAEPAARKAGETGDDVLTVEDGLANDKADTEAEASRSDLYRLAHDFSMRLDDKKAFICAYFDEMSMEEMAEALGLGGPSSISGHKAKLIDAFKNYAAQMADALSDENDQRFFITAVANECKKRCPAPRMNKKGCKK